METRHSLFNEQHVLHELKHYLPAQAPLKDFIHHNTLHAFQQLPFFEALSRASEIFGYKTSLSLEEYREMFGKGKIKEEVLEKVISDKMGASQTSIWKTRLHSKKYNMTCNPRVGWLRSHWEKDFNLDLDVLVHPILFRVICSYLDQGIAIWNFPVLDKGFLNAIREIEKNSFTSFFRSPRAKELLRSRCKISDLLKIIVGEEQLFESYLYDQQFAHQGWSGMVSAVEDHPETLLDSKRITLKDVIIFELLLEIDALDQKFGEVWAPVAHRIKELPAPLFSETPVTEYDEVLMLWQLAYEWTY